MFTLGDLPRRSARVHANKEAIVFGNARLTFAQFDRRVNRVANALLKLELKKGERIAILSENSDKYLEVYFGAAKAGLVIVPLNFRLTNEELVQIVQDCEPVLFFAGAGYEGVASTIRRQVRSVLEWISLDSSIDGFVYYQGFLDGCPDLDPLVELGEHDLAVLMYTGGTTGLPKGVMLTHRNLLSATFGMALGWQFSQFDSTCMFLPLFHASIWPVFVCLLVGGKVILVRRPELGLILEAIHNEKCTHMNAVPTIYNWLLDYPDLDKFDLSSLRLIIYSGSPMPLEILKRCMNKFGKVMAQGYGLTEAAPLVTMLLPHEHVVDGPGARLLLSAGKESAPVEVRVVGDDGFPLKAGEDGEIVVRGPNITPGYWKKEELTKEKIRDGWLYTGDIGRLDEEGYLFLVDRKADMIVTGGENVYPTETENVLYQHPAVHECAVVSAPDNRWGERVQAVVVLKPEAAVTEEELIAFTKERLAGYKCPKKIEFWDHIPKTSVGKLLRKDVKKQFWKGMERNVG
ncbi:MAG: long-chain-fatty-acid--CoA ligase [Syntrophobacteraceae bacterium]|nr:long-chain-fatty-acid--CoA ligase [Syntrophobacteraceae bacterium]